MRNIISLNGVCMQTDKEQVNNFLDIVSQQLDRWIETIDVESLSLAKKLILDAEAQGGRVHVTGIGKPGHVAGYIASLFSSTGTPTYELHGTEAVHGSSGQVRTGDVVIAISNSGETAELRATVENVKKNGAQIISVTRSRESWLGQAGDVTLVASVEQEGDYMNKPPRTSILVEIIVLQVLSILLQNEKNITPDVYVRWHPGGSLGKSIRDGER